MLIWYCAGVMLPKHSIRTDLMLLYQERSRQICSVRAAFMKLDVGCAIALLRYFIHSLMHPNMRGSFPVSPQRSTIRRSSVYTQEVFKVP